MIRELEDALVLLKDLPEKYQRQALRYVHRTIFIAEEEMTMTEEQQEAQYQTVREAMAKRSGYKSYREYILAMRLRYPDLDL